MSVKTKPSPAAHKNIDEEIIGGSTLHNLSIFPPQRRPNNAEKSTSRYTLRPPIILFIQHNEFICLEGSQLIKDGKNVFLCFSVVFSIISLRSYFSPSGVYNHLLNRDSSLFFSLPSTEDTRIYSRMVKKEKKSLWNKNVYECYFNMERGWKAREKQSIKSKTLLLY